MSTFASKDTVVLLSPQDTLDLRYDAELYEKPIAAGRKIDRAKWAIVVASLFIGLFVGYSKIAERIALKTTVPGRIANIVKAPVDHSEIE
jgi:hypothetical protein